MVGDPSESDVFHAAFGKLGRLIVQAREKSINRVVEALVDEELGGDLGAITASAFGDGARPSVELAHFVATLAVEGAIFRLLADMTEQEVRIVVDGVVPIPEEEGPEVLWEWIESYGTFPNVFDDPRYRRTRTSR